MKKLLILIVLIIFISGGAGVYTMSRYHIEELIDCAANERASYIPAFVCESYLYNFRGHPADIRFLENRTGLNFLVNIENPDKRRQLFEFFIDRGMDINAPSRIDGLSPLHAAVLLNDPALVHLLLKNGASPLVRERSNGLTPLEFLTQMDTRLPGIDRSRVKQLLEKASL